MKVNIKCVIVHLLCYIALPVFFSLVQGHMLFGIEEVETYLRRPFFMKQHFVCVCVCVCGTDNRHRCRVLGRGNPHDVAEHKHDSLKVNAWCSLIKNKVFSPFFFEELTVTGDTFLATIEGIALRHVAVGTVFTFVPFWTGSLPVPLGFQN